MTGVRTTRSSTANDIPPAPVDEGLAAPKKAGRRKRVEKEVALVQEETIVDEATAGANEVAGTTGGQAVKRRRAGVKGAAKAKGGDREEGVVYCMDGVLHTLPDLYRATVLARPSRSIKSPYLADVQLEDGTLALCHSPSLGCMGLISAGATILVAKVRWLHALPSQSIQMMAGQA